MTQDAFNNLWELEDIPACDVGMVLLKRWADAYPQESVEYLPNIAWADPPRRLRYTPEWIAYFAHRGDCPNCNEMP